MKKIDKRIAKVEEALWDFITDNNTIMPQEDSVEYIRIVHSIKEIRKNNPKMSIFKIFELVAQKTYNTVDVCRITWFYYVTKSVINIIK